jgi:glucose-6-phosphate dehydrogenase assembly protein OpcA
MVALHRRDTAELLAEELRRLDPDEVYAETLSRLDERGIETGPAAPEPDERVVS